MKTLHIVHTDGQVRDIECWNWDAPGRLLIVYLDASHAEREYFPLGAIKYFREFSDD